MLLRLQLWFLLPPLSSPHLPLLLLQSSRFQINLSQRQPGFDLESQNLRSTFYRIVEHGLKLHGSPLTCLAPIYINFQSKISSLSDYTSSQHYGGLFKIERDTLRYDPTYWGNWDRGDEI